jgi:hypothetical protein
VSCNVEEITIAGICRVRRFHSSWTFGSSERSKMSAFSRNVVAPNTMRCSASNKAARYSRSSGPCLLQ